MENTKTAQKPTFTLVRDDASLRATFQVCAANVVLVIHYFHGVEQRREVMDRASARAEYRMLLNEGGFTAEVR